MKQRFLACLAVATLGLLTLSPLFVQEPKPRGTLRGHISLVSSLAYSPDSKTLASGSFDKTVKLWDVKTAKEQATLQGHTGWVCSLAYSPDGATLSESQVNVIPW